MAAIAYRDGSFDSYAALDPVANDLDALGAFIAASLEVEAAPALPVASTPSALSASAPAPSVAPATH